MMAMMRDFLKSHSTGRQITRKSSANKSTKSMYNNTSPMVTLSENQSGNILQCKHDHSLEAINNKFFTEECSQNNNNNKISKIKIPEGSSMTQSKASATMTSQTTIICTVLTTTTRCTKLTLLHVPPLKKTPPNATCNHNSTELSKRNHWVQLSKNQLNSDNYDNAQHSNYSYKCPNEISKENFFQSPHLNTEHSTSNIDIVLSKNPLSEVL
jgi:hypothetical protein